MVDIYQQRYWDHLARKRRVTGKADPTRVFEAIRARRSQRVFDGDDITETELEIIYEAIRLAPSSCNRQAILVKPVNDRRGKEWLDTLLVGGRDWLVDAQIVLLLFADMLAYKSPAEVDFMPYLDAGFVGGNVYLAATALGVGVCFVNPNIRKEDREQFDQLFNQRRLQFCGALALGGYKSEAPESPKRGVGEIFV